LKCGFWKRRAAQAEVSSSTNVQKRSNDNNKTISAIKPH